MLFILALLMFVGAYLSTDWRMTVGGVIVGIGSAWLGWEFFTASRPSHYEPGAPRKYPRITEGDGVWVEEWDDFEWAVVEMAPTVWKHVPMDEAKRMGYHDERRK